MYFKGLYQIKSLKIENFRCFENLDIDFQTSLTLVSGLAGTGKTALFEAINLLSNPYFSNSFKLNFDKTQHDKKNLSIISVQIIPIYLKTNEIDINNYELFNRLKDLVPSDNLQPIKIEIKIAKQKNFIFNYKLNEFDLDIHELNQWVSFLDGNLSIELPFNDREFSLKSKVNFFSSDLSPELRYEILIYHLKLSKTILQFQNLEQEIKKFEIKSTELEETISEGKAYRNDLIKDIEVLNQYKTETDRLKALENELVWSPVVQIEDRINAQVTTIETTKTELVKIKLDIESKEIKRENLVKETNQIETEKKKKNQEFETIRKSYLEKKSRIDRLDKQIDNYEKSLKRISFDERQKQMKISDNQRMITEFDEKKKKNKSEVSLESKNKIQEELSTFQRELKELEEKKSAYEKEKKVTQINKKKLESTVTSFSLQLQTVRDVISEYETNSEELVNQNDKLYLEIDNLKEKSMQIEEKLIETEKEIKKSRENFVKLQKEVEQSKIPKPENVRAKNTIDTLINNVKQRINDLETMNLNTNANIELKKHNVQLDTLQNDFKELNKSNMEIEIQLSEWKEQWKNSLSSIIRQIEEKMNYFLNSWNFTVKIDLLFPDSPSNGFLNIKIFKNQTNYILDYLSSSQRSIFNFVWQLSLASSSNYNILMVDEELQKINSIDTKNLLKILENAYTEGKLDNKFQIIILHYLPDFDFSKGHSISQVNLPQN